MNPRHDMYIFDKPDLTFNQDLSVNALFVNPYIENQVSMLSIIRTSSRAA